MMRRFLLLLVLLTAPLPLRGGEPVCVYSPDGKMVTAWMDTQLGKELTDIRSIVMTPVGRHDGEILFSKITTPRSTSASWSPDSRNCVIYDAPDNGNVFFWIVAAGKTTEGLWTAREIHPMDSLDLMFEKNHMSKEHWDNTLWRPWCKEMTWLDDGILVLSAMDNDGEYRITIKLSDPDHPAITKIKDRTR